MRAHPRLLAFLALCPLVARASSDNERYGSSAWYNARNNESHQSHYYASTANSSTYVDMSAEKARLAAYFNGIAAHASTSHSNNSYQENRSWSPPDSSPPRVLTLQELNEQLANAGSGDAIYITARHYEAINDGRTALAWYLKLAAFTNSDAWDGLYRAYAVTIDNHLGVQDVPKALDYLRQYADRGGTNGLDLYADELTSGAHAPIDKAKAFPYRLTSARRGTFSDYLIIAEAYAKGDGVGKDVVAALEWYAKAVQVENPALAEAAKTSLFRWTDDLLVASGKSTADPAELRHVLALAAQIDATRVLRSAQAAAIGSSAPVDISAAIACYEEAINSPTANAEIRRVATEQLMAIYLDGPGVPKDLRRARALGLAEMERNDPEFHPLALGLLLVDPALGTPQEKAAWICFEANQASLDAQRESGFLLASENLVDGVPHDFLEGRRRLEKAGLASDAASIAFLADFHRLQLTDTYASESHREAREFSQRWARRGAEKGDVESRAKIGSWLIEDAVFAPANPQKETQISEGWTWLNQAVAAQNATGLAVAGRFYLQGIGVAKDARKAAPLLTTAAAAGSESAKILLAKTALNGEPSTIDRQAALKILQELAPSNPEAASLLGIQLWHEATTEQDGQAAVEWLKKAAKVKDAGASFELSFIYHKGGLGIEADEEEALELLRNGGPSLEQRARALDEGTRIDENKLEAESSIIRFGNLSWIENAPKVETWYLEHKRPDDAALWKGRSQHDNGNYDSPTLLFAGEELEEDGTTRLKALSPTALATIDRLLPRFQAAVALIGKPGRPSFFHYHSADSPDSPTSRTDDPTWRALSTGLETAERQRVFAALDLQAASEGDFAFATYAYLDYLCADPVRGESYWQAVKRLVLADAEGGDVAAMNKLVALNAAAPSYENTALWEQSDRDAVKWATRAALAGSLDAVPDMIYVFGGRNDSERADEKEKARWQKLAKTFENIPASSPDYQSRVAAYARENLAVP